MTFSLTTAAAEQIRRSAADSGAASWALRVAARRGDDGSIHYGIGFDDRREGDLPLEIAGVPLLIGTPSQPLLQDTRLDYVELEPGRFDFIFIAYDAAAQAPTRGCGQGGCNRCGG
jgi:iron-sulfur cluster assembly protein